MLVSSFGYLQTFITVYEQELPRMVFEIVIEYTGTNTLNTSRKYSTLSSQEVKNFTVALQSIISRFLVLPRNFIDAGFV